MAVSAATLLVSVCAPLAVVKINGRATFQASVDFKHLIYALKDQGITEFIFDVTDCLIMDSTFLGVLAGFALRFEEEGATPEDPPLRLINPNERIADLIENLGVDGMFRMIQTAEKTHEGGLQPVKANGEPCKVELSRNCLEAHKTLMALNPDNASKFKEVARYLAEDLARAEAAKAAS